MCIVRPSPKKDWMAFSEDSFFKEAALYIDSKGATFNIDSEGAIGASSKLHVLSTLNLHTGVL
jgi:hypothetical protein